MKTMFYRIKNAFKIGWWAFKNPQTMQAHNFKMLSDLLVLIMKVATEDRAYMTHIAYVNPTDGKVVQMVSIWAGAGAAASPVKRIDELLTENSKLRAMLAQSNPEEK